MNRLTFSKCYLIGPMDQNRDAGRTWREELTPFLNSLGVLVFDPYKKPILGEEGLEDDITYALVQNAIQQGNYDEASRLMKKTRSVDLRMVDHSDFYIVNLDLQSRPCGTWEEIFTANRQKKPIIIKCHKKKELPPWLNGTIPHKLFFETWDEIKEYIRHIHEDAHVEHLNRWIFFDFKSQIENIIKTLQWK